MLSGVGFFRGWLCDAKKRLRRDKYRFPRPDAEKAGWPPKTLHLRGRRMPHQLAAWGRRIDGPPRAARVGDATHGDAVSMGRVGTPHQWAAWGRRIDGPRGVAV